MELELELEMRYYKRRSQTGLGPKEGLRFQDERFKNAKMGVQFVAKHRHGKPIDPLIYNPAHRPIDELPVIYGYVSGANPKGCLCLAVSSDGDYLGNRWCTSPEFMAYDLSLAIDGGCQMIKFYLERYQNGFRCVAVPHGEEDSHVGLQKALDKLEAKTEGRKRTPQKESR